MNKLSEVNRKEVIMKTITSSEFVSSVETRTREICKSKDYIEFFDNDLDEVMSQCLFDELNERKISESIQYAMHDFDVKEDAHKVFVKLLDARTADLRDNQSLIEDAMHSDEYADATTKILLSLVKA